MAGLLQPECNFLHGYFRCWLPVEVVDMEVKVTSMQGMHIFRRNRTMQLIKCTLWNTRLCPHPTIIKKMKTFLEVEGKMGPIPQPASSQYRPPQLDTNPKVRKDNTAKKRKRAVSTIRFRPSTDPKPNETAAQPPAPEDPENKPPPLEKTSVCESTPWPGAGRMPGNLFEDRNWLFPPNYLNKYLKKATILKSTIKKEPKTGEQEKCGWGPDCLFCKDQENEDWDGKHQSQLQKGSTITRSTETTSQMTAKHELSKAPKHTDIYPGGTTW